MFMDGMPLGLIKKTMSETIEGRKIFSLIEVTQSIRKTLMDRYKSSFWVKAEMIKLNHYTKSGHCYPDLVEKKDGVLIAQIRANLWKDDYLQINRKFIDVLKEPLKDGIKILFLARITFEPVHGLALRIMDIDPGYTLGDLEKEKQETILKLKSEGIFNRNKLLKLPLLPQRIAIISVQTSKGYADFLSVIDRNPWHYKFFHLLFPSLLQGENAVKGILSQLMRIKKVLHHFDIVAIVRGGGGDIGLSCYNDYQLAKEIALFPLPVITGIGHATNETVAELISHTNAITPTKLAEHLIQQFHNFSVPVQKAEEKIIERSMRMIKDEKSRFQSEIKLFMSLTSSFLLSGRSDIKSISKSLIQHFNFRLRNERESLATLKNEIKKDAQLYCQVEKRKIVEASVAIQKDVSSQLNQAGLEVSQQARQIVQGSKFLIRNRFSQVEQTTEKLIERTNLFIRDHKSKVDSIEMNIDNMNPLNVLKRGYSITLLNGKAVINADQVKKGDALETIIAEGSIHSIVETTNKRKEE
jgi:exodeoxyribonuclease VII large subunit